MFTVIGDPRQNIAITFGTEKLEWRARLSDGEFFLLLISTEYTNVTDERTDGQTPRDGVGRDRVAKIN